MSQDVELELTITQGFDAMRCFIEAFWERSERTNDELAMLLGATERLDNGLPIDHAMWSDWLAAVKRATS